MGNAAQRGVPNLRIGRPVSATAGAGFCLTECIWFPGRAREGRSAWATCYEIRSSVPERTLFLFLHHVRCAQGIRRLCPSAPTRLSSVPLCIAVRAHKKGSMAEPHRPFPLSGAHGGETAGPCHHVLPVIYPVAVRIPATGYILSFPRKPLSEKWTNFSDKGLRGTKSGRSLRDPGFEIFAQAPRGLIRNPLLSSGFRIV